MKCNAIISDPYKSCFISANAGSGKTKVIIDRIIALIINGFEPSKILALTFTNAAAAEMLERVVVMLEKYIVATDEEIKNYLAELHITNYSLCKVKENLKNATEKITEFKIQTIHSFCQSLLQKYSFEAGIGNNFTIIEENHALELQDLAKEEFFQIKAVEEVSAYFFKKFHYNIITEIIAEIIAKRVKIEFILDKYPDFAAYIAEIYSFLQITINKDYERDILAELKEKLDISFLQELELTILKNGAKTDLARLDALNNLIEKLLANNYSFKDFKAFFCKKDGVLRAKLVTKKIADSIKNYQENILIIYKSYNDLEQKYKLYEMAEFMENYAFLARVYLANYQAIKQKENLLDYEDIILYSIKLLKSAAREQVLYNCDKVIQHILLDEAQDTSPWQWEIIKLLLEDFFAAKNDYTTKNKLNSFFIVGDEKQSIYSFQGADHKLFHEIKQEFKKRLNLIDEELYEINLEKSYRSQEDILALIDGFANLDEVKSALSLDNKAIKHEVTRVSENAQIELWKINDNSDDSDASAVGWSYPQEFIDKIYNEDAGAERVAAFIASKLQARQVLATSKDVIKPSDILILCRKKNQSYQALIRALSKKSIKVSGDTKFTMLNYVLIMDLIGFLKFVFFPNDDLNLASILKSPLFAVSEAEIFSLCHARGEVSLIEVIKEKKPLIYEKLAYLCQLELENSLDEFYLYLLDYFGLREKYIKQYGKTINDLLNSFLDIAANFTARNDNKKDFLEFMHNYDIQGQINMVEAEDIVKIMTIHKAKGLQAPIVFVIFDNLQENSFKRNYIEIDYHNNLLMAANYRKIDFLAEYFAELEKVKRAEELRLIYVALTRARDEVYMISFTKKDADNFIYEKLLNLVQQENYAELADKYIKKSAILALEAKVDKQENSNKYKEFILDDEVATEKIAKFNRDKETSYLEDEVAIGEIYHALFAFLVNGGKLELLPNKLMIIAVNLADDIRNEILTNITEIYNSEIGKLFFHNNGLAELSLNISENGKNYQGRLDLLLMQGERAKIIDYKFCKNPIVIDQYKEQLDFYEKLLYANYPQLKIIEKYNFFIKQKKLVKIN
jgi:ATP-dependent helicase/nuclease subunit A